MFRKLIVVLSLLFLSACSVDKCNDYYIAYECTYQYGDDCRNYYIQMCEECSNKE